MVWKVMVVIPLIFASIQNCTFPQAAVPVGISSTDGERRGGKTWFWARFFILFLTFTQYFDVRNMIWFTNTLDLSPVRYFWGYLKTFGIVRMKEEEEQEIDEEDD